VEGLGVDTSAVRKPGSAGAPAGGAGKAAAGAEGERPRWAGRGKAAAAGRVRC
jgi:hypothetical protein